MAYLKSADNEIDGTAGSLAALGTKRKWPISYSSVGVVAMTSDFVCILFCGVATGMLYNLTMFGVRPDILGYLAAPAVVAALFISTMKGRGSYNPVDLLVLKTQFSRVTTTWAGVFLLLSGAAFALKIGSHFSRGGIFSFAVFGLALLLFQRVLYRDILTYGLNAQRFSGRNAVLISDAPAAENALVDALLRHGFQLNRQFTLPIYRQDPSQLDGTLSEIVAYLRGSNVEEVILSLDSNRWHDLDKLVSGLRVLPLPVSLIPVGATSDILRRPTHLMGDCLRIELQRAPLRASVLRLKRSIDVFGALAGLFLLLPLLIMTAILIKLDSSGPIVFHQRRCGFNGRPFHIFKFRTMSVLEDGPTVCQAEESDSRVTRVGRILRRTSIDELPQLLNVLTGSMSLVGPRPHALTHDDHFDKIVRNYAFRNHVKPGLTGWAQVHGQRGPTPTLADIEKRVELDLWYIENWSLRLDCLIIIRTFFEVIVGRNAY
jgi:Undecaprenyl-phosphate glucose phosphotransferase